MAYSSEVQGQARQMYVHGRLNQAVIAERLGVALETIRRWKKLARNQQDDWDRARAVSNLSSHGMRDVVARILEDYLLQHEATIEAVRVSKDISPLERAEVISRLADAFTKTVAAVGKTSPQLSRLAVASDVIQRLSRHISERHPHLAPGLLEILEPFAAELARDYD